MWSSDGAALTELQGHTAYIGGVATLTDGRLLSWSGDGTLRLWAADGTFLSLWLWPYAGIDRVVPNPNRPNVYWVIAGNDVLQVRHQPEGTLVAEEEHEVFLSYAREDAAIVRSLHADLNGAGFRVWYDRDIAAGIGAGEDFRKRIRAQIDAAKAVVVLWSKASAESDWVIAEASRAHDRRKLIPLLLAPLRPQDVPDPFAVLDILPYAANGDIAALKRALERKGIRAR
jgi:hypothetical protein